MDRQALLELRERRARFSDWERAATEARFPEDLRRRLDWYASAWRLAARFDPAWNRKDLGGGHLRHLAEVRARLAHLGRLRGRR